MWGELELSFELTECETYQRIIEQAYPLGRGDTKTVSRILGCFPVQVIHWGFRPLCRGNTILLQILPVLFINRCWEFARANKPLNCKANNLFIGRVHK